MDASLFVLCSAFVIFTFHIKERGIFLHHAKMVLTHLNDGADM